MPRRCPRRSVPSWFPRFLPRRLGGSAPPRLLPAAPRRARIPRATPCALRRPARGLDGEGADVGHVDRELEPLRRIRLQVELAQRIREGPVQRAAALESDDADVA